MATFKRIEEIAAWRGARDLSKRIYQLIAEGSFARDFPLIPGQSWTILLKDLNEVATENF